MANFIIDSLHLSNDKHVFTLPYGESSTAAGTAAKTVTVDNFVGSLTELVKGTTINVKFTNANTVSNPTLNVNGLGAIAISSPYTVKGGAYKWTAGSTLLLTYDGTNWVRQFVEDTQATIPSLSKGTDSAGTAKTLAHGGKFSAVTDTTVNGHAITDVVTEFTLPSETVLSKGANATATKTLTHGGTFTAVTGTSVDGHIITDTVTTFTMPSVPSITETETAKTATITPNASKKATFVAISEIGASGHTITDDETTYTLDLSAFATTAELSSAMVFKGTLGTNGTITALPTASTSTVGDTYKVITAGTYASIAAKVGDVFVCSSAPAWVLIPSGDEPSGTVTNIATGVGLVGGPITSTGTIKANLKSETALSSAAGTGKIYPVAVDSEGHLAVSVPWVDTDTDTHYTTGIKAGASGTNSNSAATNPYVKVLDNTTYRSQIQLKGSGATTVKSDASGVITISSTDTNTHNSHTINSGKKADGSTDIVGASSSGALVMGDSGVTSGEYGPTANATLAHSGTFVIPDIKVNAKGIVTSVTNRTMTLPKDNNTTYTPEKLGFGYAVQNNSAASATITATLANYVLVKNGSVDVKFTYDVPANSTLSINNKDAKAIYCNGAAITAGVLKAGDIARFVYDGTNYQLASIDKASINFRTHTHTVEHTPAGTNSSVDYTPAGTVSKPTFTGTAASHKHTFTGTAAAHAHTITADAVELVDTITPAGTVTVTLNTGNKSTGAATTSNGHTAEVSLASHTHSYTPEGTISTPALNTETANTGACSGKVTFNAVKTNATPPSLTHNGTPDFKEKTVASKCLTITFDAAGHTFNPGTVPVLESVKAANAVHTHTYVKAKSVSAPTFTGTAKTIAASSSSATVSTSSHTHSTSGLVTGVKSASFSGTPFTIDHTHGHTGNTAEASITPAGTISETSITPSGTVSQPTFTGTKWTHTHTFTGTKATITTSVPK